MTEREDPPEGRLNLNRYKDDMLAVQKFYDAFMPYVKDVQSDEVFLEDDVVFRVRFKEPITAQVYSLYEVDSEKVLTEIDAHSFGFYMPGDDTGGNGFMAIELYEVSDDENTQVCATVRIDQVADWEIVGRDVKPLPEEAEPISVNMLPYLSALHFGMSNIDKAAVVNRDGQGFVARPGYHFVVAFRQPYETEMQTMTTPLQVTLTSFSFNELDIYDLLWGASQVTISDNKGPDGENYLDKVPLDVIASLWLVRDTEEAQDD